MAPAGWPGTGAWSAHRRLVEPGALAPLLPPLYARILARALSEAGIGQGKPSVVPLIGYDYLLGHSLWKDCEQHACFARFRMTEWES
jgi:hypothetical protein